jgi:hypothetical protein
MSLGTMLNTTILSKQYFKQCAHAVDVRSGRLQAASNDSHHGNWSWTRPTRVRLSMHPACSQPIIKRKLPKNKFALGNPLCRSKSRVRVCLAVVISCRWLLLIPPSPECRIPKKVPRSREANCNFQACS